MATVPRSPNLSRSGQRVSLFRHTLFIAIFLWICSNAFTQIQFTNLTEEPSLPLQEYKQQSMDKKRLMIHNNQRESAKKVIRESSKNKQKTITEKSTNAFPATRKHRTKEEKEAEHAASPKSKNQHTGQEPALKYFEKANASAVAENNGPASALAANITGTPSQDDLLPFNRVVQWAIFGLGHRLCRTTAVWHLAKSLNLTRMKFQWGTCGEDDESGPKIFPHLFGDDVFSVPSSNQSTQRGKEVLVRNDAYGYIPGQTFKNHQLPLPSIYKDPKGPFLEKLISDVELYQLLRDRYIYKDQMLDFMKKHKFEEHTVLGIHLRAGNGEKDHFEESRRGISNEMEFVSNFTRLVHRFIETVQVSHPDRFQKKKPLIFLATDTVSLVPSIVNATRAFGVSTIILPQIRVNDNEGVTFEALQGAGTECLEGWKAMFSDMFLLSHSDVLIAPRRSSFTQSLPLSLVFDQTRNEAGPHFCEGSSTASSMTCFEDLATWLFRDDDSKIVTYSWDGSKDQIIHKLLVHLPDIKPPKEFTHAVHFLNDGVQGQQSMMTHTYGSTQFNTKYRKRKHNGMLFSWNFVGSNNNSTTREKVF